MRLDGIRLLVGKARLLAFAELLDQTHGLSLEAAGKLAANAAREKLHELMGEKVVCNKNSPVFLLTVSWSLIRDSMGTMGMG